MKKHTFFTGLLLLLVTVVMAQNLPADKIVGVWLTENKDLKIEIFKMGNTYSGKLLWAKDMFEADGKTPKKDTENPDKKLRSRSRQGLVNITGLVYIDGAYTNGESYNPKDGNTYSLKAVLKSADKLEVRGYKGVSLLGKTIKWTRVK